MAEHKITFLPHKKSGFFEKGISIRDAALELGILIESDCAGIGTCAKCKVNVKDGVSSPSQVEKNLLARHELDKGVRLSCQAQIAGNSLCVIPPESQPMAGQILTSGMVGQTTLDPDIKKVLLNVPSSRLGEKYFDFEKVLNLLGQKGHLIRNYDFQIVRNLPELRHGDENAFTAVIDQEELLAIESGDTSDSLYGVAVDIGTTTVAAKLLNLNTDEVLAVISAANPQSAHGADVVSRIKYIVEHPGGLKRLNRLIIKLINGLLTSLIENAGIRATKIYKLTLAGNTVMQHIALNIDPRNLAYSPYTPVFQGPVTLKAKSLGIEINPTAAVYNLANLACFVGSDITAVLTVLDLDEKDEMQLAVDLGTNGEIVLGNKHRLLCCSSPAGPAWEGACITWGMRATHGAIERAEFIDGELRLRTIGGADPLGICGSGLIDLIGEFVRAGAIDGTGRILRASQLQGQSQNIFKEHIIHGKNGVNDIAVTRIDENRSITLTQNDVREVQLAKSAIAAGIQILMQELNVKPAQVSNVFIAGAFGNHARGQDVVDLGIIPGISPEKIVFIGNAALTGAEAVLRSKEAREKAERIAKKIEYIEIADRPEFQDNFVEGLNFAN